MAPNDLLSSPIVKHKTLGGMAEFSGGSKLGTVGASMQHEGGVGGGFPMLRSQVGSDTSGGDLSRVIERQFNGYAAEEIVKEHSVSNVTPSRLEEKMNMSHLTCHRNG